VERDAASEVEHYDDIRDEEAYNSGMDGHGDVEISNSFWQGA
jgi:hypothetical protein